MLNYGPRSQEVIGHPAILEAIEPLLGGDCHVIANTAWRNPPTFTGGPWHCDAGPHVPRPADVEWDDRIPYPVFAIGAHIMLRDCPLACGPTAVVPGSHRSGRLAPEGAAPRSRTSTYDGRPPVLLRPRPATWRCSCRTRGTAARRRGGWRRAVVPAGALRPPRHRPAPAPDGRGQPADAGGRARVPSTPRQRALVGLHDAVLLRRLNGERRALHARRSASVSSARGPPGRPRRASRR